MSKNKFIAFGNVFDESVRHALFKLSSQGYFEEMASPISIGKESNVFTVTSHAGHRCVKIYRTSASFKKMYDYMKADPRYAGIKGTKLSVVYAWAKKEFRNLHRAKEKGVSAPLPYAVYKNILVMEFFDAPLLLHKAPKKPKEFYERLISEIIKLFEAGLVHSDISEYNILNDKEKPILIDFSHALDLRYPNVQRLLMRDIHNVVVYFNKFGLELDEKKEFQRIWIHKK